MDPLPPDDLYKERYLVEGKIGQGGFGKVFLVKEKEGEKCYAAKCIKVRERIKHFIQKPSQSNLLSVGKGQERKGKRKEGGCDAEEPRQ